VLLVALLQACPSFLQPFSGYNHSDVHGHKKSSLRKDQKKHKIKVICGQRKQ